jgi:hypothetical protein
MGTETKLVLTSLFSIPINSPLSTINYSRHFRPSANSGADKIGGDRRQIAVAEKRDILDKKRLRTVAARNSGAPGVAARNCTSVLAARNLA